VIEYRGAPRDSTRQRALLVVREVDAVRSRQALIELFQQIGAALPSNSPPLVVLQLTRVLDQKPRHLLRRDDIVRETGW
jgi:hypothetical protein